MFLVAGVTGNTGSKVADKLLARGEKIRVVVRDEAKGAPWKAKGAEVAVGSLADVDFVSKSFEGIAAAYLLVPPQYQADDPIAASKRIIDGYVEALTQNDHLETVAFLSSLGAQYDKLPLGLIDVAAYSESKMLGVNVQFFFLRAAFFMENWLQSMPMIQNGVLPTFLRESFSVEMVSTEEIAHVAVDALLDPTKSWDVIQIAGPAAYNSWEVAAAFSKALGKDVKVQTIPTEEIVPIMTGMGAKQKLAEGMEQMYNAVHMGRCELKDRPFHTYRGHIGIDEFAESVVKASAAK